MIEYTVQYGDTRSKLASYYGVSPEFILANNPRLTREPLPIGMKLVLPLTKISMIDWTK